MKIILTGADGFLGKKVFSYLNKEGFDVVPLYHKDVDITKYEVLKKFFYKVKPDFVVHTAALTSVDYCEEHKEEAFRVNVIATDFMQDLCYELKAKLLFTSTNYVFDGEKGNYKEDDERNPVNYYGLSKLAAEDITLKSPNNIILRPSLLYGFNDRNDKAHFVSFIVNKLNKGEQVNVAADLVLNPTLIDDVAIAIKKLIDKDAIGVFNCSGSEKISRYDFAVKIARFFNLNSELIKPVLSSRIDFKAKRPRDSSLDNSKIKKLGISTSRILEGFRKANYKF